MVRSWLGGAGFRFQVSVKYSVLVWGLIDGMGGGSKVWLGS